MTFSKETNMEKKRNHKSYKKILLASAVLTIAAGAALAFDWPQDETSSDSFFSYFGQLRGGTIETSLIFKDNSTVKTAQDGIVAAVITEHTDDFGWFESTLGNAVIIAHDDNFSTVYGNLDGETLEDVIYSPDTISGGTALAVSGNSGWQEGQSCLEFQVLDTQNSAAINPRNLMPRMGAELPLEIGKVTLRGAKGLYNLSTDRYISSGKYAVYHARQTVAVPYKTSIAINGATVENTTYDTLRETNGKLCVSGNEPYPVEEVYPDSEKQLLGNIQLNRGRNTITIALTDILGTTVSSSYTVDVN